ncbi:MAG: alkaline phosphatase [Bryobacteraceae bacterium]
MKLIPSFAVCALLVAPLFAQSSAPSVRILLPERTRLLQGQQVDLVLEVRNAAAVTAVKVMAGNTEITAKFEKPVAAQLDCDDTSDWVVRANLQSFQELGTVKMTATVTAGATVVSDSRDILVRPFSMPTDGTRRNVILFIGDAMGTAYRDAARLVSRSTVDANGRNAFRDGFFDDLLEMDKMPISGMSMTYGTDSIVPDSANTGTAWATGNKSFLNAVNVFTDGTDCRWRFTGAANAANLPALLDNPRVETLWEYLRRLHGYRTGIVTTADVTDATPAVQASHSAFRQTRFEIARQYLENPMLGGRPGFDVIMGGGMDQFTAAARVDQRNLLQEFQNRGYRLVTTATALRGISYGQPTLGLFKGSANPAPASDRIRSAADVNMDVAYDKLGLPRPASEPAPNFGGYTDQPMLELMTAKAIEILSSSFGQQPFALMVEAASIDKQSHPNHASGTIWDTIEMDKSVGVARAWAAKRPVKDTLIVVTADHDQSMHIIGVSNTADAEYLNKSDKREVVFTSPAGEQAFTVYGDAFSNARAGLPFINGSIGADNNRGRTGTPTTFAPATVTANPAANTYSTYFGSPAYPMDAKTGYPVNTAAAGGTLRRLAVGFRTGDHTGSSVPVTAEGTGAFLFTGYMDQSDIFFKMAAALTGDTAEGDTFVEKVLLNGKYPKSIGK